MQSESRIATTDAGTYIRQLCKHFAHKVTAEYTETHGRVQFDGGVCDMYAEPDTLVLKVEAANAETIAILQSVVDRHLEKFDHRKTLAIGTWHSSEDAAPASA
jgi:hypothetical protein